jgi:(E)-4-hydroxy-3-methylbut-2-enyl-diphosphate synthase
MMPDVKQVVRVGSVRIGGRNPVRVQSMTKTPTADISATVRQIRRLTQAGCEIVRLAVVDRNDAVALKTIKESVTLPIVADIHFDYRLALMALDAGADKIRINPGNIGETWKLKAVIKKARDRGVPIRVGINSGSLPRPILKRFHHPNARAIVAAVHEALKVFEKNGFTDIVISAKGCDVPDTVRAYESIHRHFDYPLHLGITEAGRAFTGAIKSAVGLGILLSRRIGDTIRVSLTADPVQEVVAGFEILKALKLRQKGPILISCPTCGRCRVDILKIASAVERRLKDYRMPIKVAVMGCVVNGPGEAKEADFGIACGRGMGAVFVRGREIKRVKENLLYDTLFEVIDENIDR